MRPLRTHCYQGHAYTPDNVSFNGVGNRVCKTCRSAREKVARAHVHREAPEERGSRQLLEALHAYFQRLAA